MEITHDGARQIHPRRRVCGMCRALLVGCRAHAGGGAWGSCEGAARPELGPISGLAIVAKVEGHVRETGARHHGRQLHDRQAVPGYGDGRRRRYRDDRRGAGTAAAMAGQKIAFLARTEYSYIKTLTATAAGIKPRPIAGKRIAFSAGTGGEVYTAAAQGRGLRRTT